MDFSTPPKIFLTLKVKEESIKASKFGVKPKGLCEKFAIKKKMATKTVQTNIDNHFRIDKFHIGSVNNLQIGNL